MHSLTNSFPGRRQSSVTRLGTTAAAVTVALAGLIHLVLTPEHFAERFAYGLIFAAMAAFQLALAAHLLLRPGPHVYQAGIWGSGLIALVYVATRLAPPPGSAAAEEVTAIGVLATTLEVAAVILLAVALPDTHPVRPRVAPLWWGVAGALVTMPLWLIATGSLVWTDLAFALELSWYEQRTAITPALVGAPLPHLWLFAPWWVLVAAPVLAMLVGLNLWLATRLVGEGRLSCRGRRVGLLTLIPAAFAAPLCCGTPLAALLGVPVLLRIKVAPITMLLSLALLAANLVWLWVRSKRLPTC
jgi:hypothetical protein